MVDGQRRLELVLADRQRSRMQKGLAPLSATMINTEKSTISREDNDDENDPALLLLRDDVRSRNARDLLFLSTREISRDTDQKPSITVHAEHNMSFVRRTWYVHHDTMYGCFRPRPTVGCHQLLWSPFTVRSLERIDDRPSTKRRFQWYGSASEWPRSGRGERRKVVVVLVPGSSSSSSKLNRPPGYPIEMVILGKSLFYSPLQLGCIVFV